MIRNEDVDCYVKQVLRCQELTQTHLKEFVTNKKGSITEVIIPGRVVMVFNKKCVNQPCFGMLLTANKPVAITGNSGSASNSASNNLLAGLRSTDRSFGNAAGASATGASGENYSLADESCWVLLVLPSNEKAKVFSSLASPSTPSVNTPSDPAQGLLLKKKDMFDVGFGAARGGKGAAKGTKVDLEVNWVETSGQISQLNSTGENTPYVYLVVQCPVKDFVLITNKKLKVASSVSTGDLNNCAKQLLRHSPCGEVLWAPCRNLDLLANSTSDSTAKDFESCSSFDLGKLLGKQLGLDFVEDQAHVSAATDAVLSCKLLLCEETALTYFVS